MNLIQSLEFDQNVLRPDRLAKPAKTEDETDKAIDAALQKLKDLIDEITLF